MDKTDEMAEAHGVPTRTIPLTHPGRAFWARVKEIIPGGWCCEIMLGDDVCVFREDDPHAGLRFTSPDAFVGEVYDRFATRLFYAVAEAKGPEGFDS